LREDVESRLRHRYLAQGVRRRAHRLPAQSLVVRGFRCFRGDGQYPLGARRQLLQHLRFGSSQNKGRDEALEHMLRGAIAIAFDGTGKTLVEAVKSTEQGGVDKTHDGPQFGQAIVKRCTGKGKTEV